MLYLNHSVTRLIDKPLNLTISGFGPFYETKTNASEQIVKYIDSADLFAYNYRLTTYTFPVIYQNSYELLERVINESKPDIFLLLGVRKAANDLHLERIARNLDDSDIPDNRNVIRKNRRIVDECSVLQHVSDLPLDTFAETLRSSGVPAIVSENAGGYICNHYYFLAQQICEMTSNQVVCLFVHIPPLRSNCDAQVPLSLSTVVEGLVQLIEIIEEYIGNNSKN